MSWRDVSASKLGILCCLALLFAIATPTSLHAATTQVDVLICNPNTTAQLTITTPPSDSTTSHPVVTIEGNALYTSQIEVYVDGGYNKTIALATGVTAFNTNVRLSPGTHTITLTAIDICGNAHDTKHIVITYQPGVGPQPEPHPPTPDIPGDRRQSDTAGEASKFGSDGSEQPDAITPGRDIPTDLPDEPGEGTPGEREPWPLSYVNPDPLTYLIRLAIALIGALLLSIRRRHIAKMFNQPLTVKWPFIPCALFWTVGALLVLFAIFGFIF